MPLSKIPPPSRRQIDRSLREEVSEAWSQGSGQVFRLGNKPQRDRICRKIEDVHVLQLTRCSTECSTGCLGHLSERMIIVWYGCCSLPSPRLQCVANGSFCSVNLAMSVEKSPFAMFDPSICCNSISLDPACLCHLHPLPLLWNHRINLVLWGSRATVFDAETVHSIGQRSPIVAIFVGMLVKSYKNENTLSGGTIPEIEAFFKRKNCLQCPECHKAATRDQSKQVPILRRSTMSLMSCCMLKALSLQTQVAMFKLFVIQKKFFQYPE